MGGELKDFKDASPVPLSSDCMKELGLCFHEFDLPFSSAALPEVRVTVGVSAVTFDSVVGLSITDDEKRTMGKLDALRLTLRGVPSRSDVPVAKAFAYRVINDVVQAGWIRYIYPSDPRISGRGWGRRQQCSGGILEGVIMTHPCFDPHYEMSDEQWLAGTGFYRWYFYKDGYHMKLDAWSSRGDKDPVGQASYLFTVELKSEKEFWLQAFKQKDKPRWRELLPALQEMHSARRQVIEEKAERAGIEIDRSYQNPPVSALAHKPDIGALDEED